MHSTDAAIHARQSKGLSSAAVYKMALNTITQRKADGGILVDVGCGEGRFFDFARNLFKKYIGIDIDRYKNFPAEGTFFYFNLEKGRIPLDDGIADVVCAIEVIEHLENPRAFLRELTRIVKPGGLIVITTPNQLSFLSKLTLLFKNNFNAFQDAQGLYPAHITPLLEVDLMRIFKESRLQDIRITYSNCGRIPFSPWHWPAILGFKGRMFSDNVCCSAFKAEDEGG